MKCVQTAVDAGATVINIPDTVGYSYHDEYAHIFKTLTESVTSSNEIIYSAHCHDDLGMAVSNSLAAIEGGARRIEGTVNGIGEQVMQHLKKWRLHYTFEMIIMVLKLLFDLQKKLKKHRI